MDEQTIEPTEDQYSKRVDEPEPVGAEQTDDGWLDDDVDED